MEGDVAVGVRHPALADDHGELFTATFNPAQAEKLFEEAATGSRIFSRWLMRKNLCRALR